MGGFCLLVKLHREGSALQPAQQACFTHKNIARVLAIALDTFSGMLNIIAKANMPTTIHNLESHILLGKGTSCDANRDSALCNI